MLPRRTLAQAAAAVGGALLLGSQLVSPFAGASSHREAPLIIEDPMADNTDTYAFVSTESGRSGFVTLIANYIPFQLPQGGPNFYPFSEFVAYDINVDTDGDGIMNVTYRFEFDTERVSGGGNATPFYNTGLIGPPTNPANPADPYKNLVTKQFYRLTELKGEQGPRDENVILPRARVAPFHVGPKSTGTDQRYEDVLARAAIHGFPGGGKVFVGPRDDGFTADLGATFDLANYGRKPGLDGVSNLNIQTIALEIPKSRFQQNGDTNGIIGVYASASRRTQTVLRGEGQQPVPSGDLRQVSRLANPLVNELLIPVNRKDLYNSTLPRNDGPNQIADLIVNPGNSQPSPAAFVPFLRGLTGCTATTGRADLQAILLTGIPAGVVPGFAGNFDTQTPTPVAADLMRLNYTIPPTASPNRLGVIGGDVAGYPNGRRVGDDVTDISLKVAAGAVQPLVGLPACPVAATITDNVDSTDRPFLNRFPYLATPHRGFDSPTSDGAAQSADVDEDSDEDDE